MTVSRPLKLVLFALTIWPPLYFVAFFLMIATQAFASPGVFPILFAVHALTALGMFGTLAYYLVHLFKQRHLSGDTRIMWCLVLLLAAPIGMPIYYFTQIWPAPTN